MRIIFASTNIGKIEEIKKYFKNHEIIPLLDLEQIEIEETGKTFQENAYIKAKTIYDKYRLPVIADDSGLCIESLNNEPGIYSARYSQEKTDESNMNKVIENLHQKKITESKAFFITVICFINKDKVQYFEGRVNGIVKDIKKGILGHGYDPIFYIENKSFAQISVEEKNKISHRAIAMKKLEENIRRNYE